MDRMDRQEVEQFNTGECDTTPGDLDEQSARDRLIEAIQLEQEQEKVLAAARSARRTDGMLFAALRRNGAL